MKFNGTRIECRVVDGIACMCARGRGKKFNFVHTGYRPVIIKAHASVPSWTQLSTSALSCPAVNMLKSYCNLVSTLLVFGSLLATYNFGTAAAADQAGIKAFNAVASSMIFIIYILCMMKLILQGCKTQLKWKLYSKLKTSVLVNSSKVPYYVTNIIITWKNWLWLG